ncbi:hypothetical protein F2P56_016298, partial [Juglans regia]
RGERDTNERTEKEISLLSHSPIQSYLTLFLQNYRVRFCEPPQLAFLLEALNSNCRLFSINLYIQLCFFPFLTIPKSFICHMNLICFQKKLLFFDYSLIGIQRNYPVFRHLFWAKKTTGFLLEKTRSIFSWV